MTMDLGLSAGGQSTALSMDMQIDYMQEPLAMKIEMGLSGISTEDASDRLTMYLQQTDSLLHTYMRQGQQDWQHIALPQGQLTEQM